MRRVRQGQKGFTLPEILVSITLLAILAAVVVPTIASQVKKGDPTRMGNDFLAIRGGVEQFLSDVRKYPKSIGQLTSQISTSMSPLVGSSFGKADSARWRGPYLTKDSVAADTTGYGLGITQPFDTMSLAVSGNQRGSGKLYLVATVLGIDTLSWQQVDQLFDDGQSLTGTIRWRKGTSTDTLRYLVMPIQ
ncbi:MAG TPA: prepilin-type N-terminal cleavage/methylation domain-containing protein [Gemmatimonadaceae bacterium]|nr:prepilin-type N-terminal cleavage/methylation domain-containing protein [Gemmatimonadaceae bacterium]